MMDISGNFLTEPTNRRQETARGKISRKWMQSVLLYKVGFTKHAAKEMLEGRGVDGI
jgi:hypothetical protein